MIRTIFILILATAASAQSPSGRSLGFGGAVDIYEQSSDVLTGNPAQLARVSAQKWMLDLPRFSAGAANNAFSVNYWNDQIARDHYLTVQDKREIIDRIPDDGLQVHGMASAPILGAVYKQAALQFSDKRRSMSRQTANCLNLRSMEISSIAGTNWKTSAASNTRYSMLASRWVTALSRNMSKASTAASGFTSILAAFTTKSRTRPENSWRPTR